MAVLTVQAITRAGLEPALAAAAAAGDAFPNTGREFLVVKNAHATLSRTVTVGVVSANRAQPTIGTPPRLTSGEFTVRIAERPRGGVE